MAFSYSIIIPHYNLPDLLRRCLDSIPARNDIQIIVVDDLSSDENRQKLKEMQGTYSNVQFVFCEKNGGGGAARNRGLDEAKGEYVLFADADDYFCENFDVLLDKFAVQGNDITFFNVNFVNAATGEPANMANHVAEIIGIHKKNPGKGEMLLRYYFGEPWCKMVRRSVIQEKGIRFEETKIHNDTLYSYLVGFHAKKLAVCEQPIYNYTIREGSVSRIVSDDRLLLRVSVFAQKNRFLQDNHIEFIDKMMIWPFKYCKEHHKDSVYKSCLAEAQKYGFDEKFIKNLLFKHKIRKLFQKIQRKAYKLLGIKKALKNLAYS